MRSFTSYGAFVDIGGVDALLHVSDISWSRINQPADVLTLGQEIGHMLLNTGGHTTVNRNLMNNGTNVTPEQCQRMNANLTRLFGDAEVADPGPPS